MQVTLATSTACTYAALHCGRTSAYLNDLSMAVRESVIRRQLQQFELSDVEFTGEKLKGGEGSYGYVEVVNILGTRCAAKVVHAAFIEVMYRRRAR